MARCWTRSTDVKNIAWHLDEQESAVVVAAFAVCTFGRPFSAGWLEGVRQHFICGGGAVTNAALVGLNEILVRHGLPPLRFVDEGSGRGYGAREAQSEDRVSLQATMEHASQTALFARYRTLHAQANHTGRAPAAPRAQAQRATDVLRPANRLRASLPNDDESDDAAPPSAIVQAGPAAPDLPNKPITSSEAAKAVAGKDSAFAEVVCALPSAPVGMTLRLAARPGRYDNRACPIDLVKGDEVVGVVFERRPVLDAATLAFLASAAPDAGTAAWISAYAASAPR